MPESVADRKSFFYALISFLGLFTFFGQIRQAKKDNKPILDLFTDGLSFIGRCLFCLIKWPAAILWFVLLCTPILAFRCLPISLKAPVRSGRRCVVKTVLGAEQKTEIMLLELKHDLTRREDTVKLYQSSGGTHTELAQFLGIYDMLVLVAKNLHYADLINLSTVSKSVRESVLPSNDVSRRLNMFRLYTCGPDNKTTCWNCTNQTCDGCQVNFPLRQAVIFHHVDNCVPYCASCHDMYILRHSRVRQNRFKGDPSCTCAPEPAQRRKLVWRFLNRRAYYTEPLGFPRTGRQVCHNCSHLGEEEVFLQKGKNAVLMTKKGLKSNGEKWKMCANLGCGRTLGSGPRYWICKLYGCEKECRSTVHQAWGSKADDGVIGEALV
jgi:hypothetical protein